MAQISNSATPFHYRNSFCAVACPPCHPVRWVWSKTVEDSRRQLKIGVKKTPQQERPKPEWYATLQTTFLNIRVATDIAEKSDQ